MLSDFHDNSSDCGIKRKLQSETDQNWFSKNDWTVCNYFHWIENSRSLNLDKILKKQIYIYNRILRHKMILLEFITVHWFLEMLKDNYFQHSHFQCFWIMKIKVIFSSPPGRNAKYCDERKFICMSAVSYTHLTLPTILRV